MCASPADWSAIWSAPIRTRDPVGVPPLEPAPGNGTAPAPGNRWSPFAADRTAAQQNPQQETPDQPTPQQQRPPRIRQEVRRGAIPGSTTRMPG